MSSRLLRILLFGILALTFLHRVLSASDPPSYHAALRDAQVQQRPLLVLVGADWCPGCRTMKQRVLPALARRGALRPVRVAHVNADADADTARQLMRGSSIPQLIVFSRTNTGRWHREQITGTASESEVESLIARAVKAQRSAASEAGGAIGN